MKRLYKAKTQKSDLSSSPYEGEHDRKKGAKIKAACFGEEITAVEVTIPKKCPVDNTVKTNFIVFTKYIFTLLN
jgi:hypothetical protein